MLSFVPGSVISSLIRYVSFFVTASLSRLIFFIFVKTGTSLSISTVVSSSSSRSLPSSSSTMTRRLSFLECTTDAVNSVRTFWINQASSSPPSVYTISSKGSFPSSTAGLGSPEAVT